MPRGSPAGRRRTASPHPSRTTAGRARCAGCPHDGRSPSTLTSLVRAGRGCPRAARAGRSARRVGAARSRGRAPRRAGPRTRWRRCRPQASAMPPRQPRSALTVPSLIVSRTGDDRVAPVTSGAARRVDEIPVVHTPPGGYGKDFPAPVLAACSEEIVAGAPDLRGTWEVVEVVSDGNVVSDHPALGSLQRIEQCGDRLVVTGGGIVHDMRCDGTEEHGVHDVAEFDKADADHGRGHIRGGRARAAAGRLPDRGHPPPRGTRHGVGLPRLQRPAAAHRSGRRRSPPEPGPVTTGGASPRGSPAAAPTTRASWR